jgi:ketosteroid isomerase-like protein
MSEEQNIKFIKDHFAAFERGDIQSAMRMIAEDVDWQSPVSGTPPNEITWAKPCNNSKQVLKFFQELAQKVQTKEFEIMQYIAQGDHVVVEGRNKGKIRTTGKIYEHDWVMLFKIIDNKIVRHRHYYDTNDIVMACKE